MVNQQQIIDYFENLATQHRLLASGTDNKKAFFFIPAAYNLTEIDNAIRNLKIAPFLALDAMSGRLDDNTNETHIQYIDLQFSVLDMAKVDQAETIRAARERCFQIGSDILARIKTDSRKRQLFTPQSTFRINNVNYSPIGPMEIKYYGYTFQCSISCPFGYTVNGATWLDIP